MQSQTPTINVVCHHPVDALGGVTASLQTWLTQSGTAFRWLDCSGPLDGPLPTNGTWIFNGGFSLAASRGLNALEELCGRGLSPFIYWHETVYGLRRLQGLPLPDEATKHVPDVARRRLSAAVTHPSVRHLAASSVTKVAVSTAFGVHPNSVGVVYECIKPPPSLHVVDSGGTLVRICSAGVDDPRKNAQLFAELAASGVEGSRTQWTWFGPNSYVEQLPAVKSPGTVVPLQKYLATQDLFLSLSYDEPMSVAALEALSVGIPVLCLESTGLAEIVPKSWIIRSHEDIVRTIQEWSGSAWPEPSFCAEIARPFLPTAFGERLSGLIQTLSNNA